MNSNRDLERWIADYYAHEGVYRAPDSVLAAALTTIENTRQRRVLGELLGRLPWRVPDMSNYMRLAVAAVALTAAVAVGWAIYSGRPPTIGTSPSPGTSLSPSPSLPASVAPSASTSSPPALTEPFASEIHGVAFSHPAGWTALAATEPWMTGWPENAVAADYIYEKETDSPFVALASQPLSGRSSDDWVAEISTHADWNDACIPQAELITIDGAPGSLFGAGDCPGVLRALTSVQDRGYLIIGYRIDDVAWFKEILATVQLDPLAARAWYAPDFQVPFGYVVPDGPEFDYGTTNATWFEVRVPEYADAGHPGGVILQAIGGGREDPCDAASSELAIEAGPQAVIDYLKTIPQIEVTDEAPATVGDLAAVQATVVATATTACPEIWPWLEDTESIPSGPTLRIVAVDVGDEHLVFSVFGEDTNPGFSELTAAYIESIRFE